MRSLQGLVLRSAQRTSQVLAAVTLLGATPCTGQHPESAMDSVLYCYWLSSGCDVRPRPGDGEISPCWDEWDGRDSAVIPGSDGQEPMVVAKAAADGKGLYLLFVISDDTLVRDSLDERWVGDALVFLTDTRSSDEVADCDSSCFYESPLPSLTNNGHLYTFCPGASQNEGPLWITYYDANLWSWVTRNVTSETGLLLYSVGYDVVSREGKAYVEWWTGWDDLGVPTHDQYGMPYIVGFDWVADRHFAFAFGYADCDSQSQIADTTCWPMEDAFMTPAALGDIVIAEWNSAVEYPALRMVSPSTGAFEGIPPVTALGRKVRANAPSSLPAVLPGQVLLPAAFRR